MKEAPRPRAGLSRAFREFAAPSAARVEAKECAVRARLRRCRQSRLHRCECKRSRGRGANYGWQPYRPRACETFVRAAPGRKTSRAQPGARAVFAALLLVRTLEAQRRSSRMR